VDTSSFAPEQGPDKYLISAISGSRNVLHDEGGHMATRISPGVMAAINLVGFLGVVVVNGLANALPINNKTTAQLSDQYPNLFVPAGLTFAIWGLIYLLLAIFVAYGLIQAIRRSSGSDIIQKIGLLFFLSCVANMGWIFAWQYEIVPLSLVIMLLLLACLLAIYIKLGVGRRGTTGKERYFVHLPFSVYLGWITIATIANVTALLVDVHWGGWGLSEQFWAVLVILVGIAITLAMLFRRQDIFYALVVDWALLGILIKRLASTVPAQSVIAASIAGLVVISIVIIIQLVLGRVYAV
jgi:hypothetical protein